MFRRMSNEMTEEEIGMVFQIVLPFGKMLDYERHPQTNYISVRYVIPEENPKEHEMNLLPSDQRASSLRWKVQTVESSFTS